MDCFRKQSSSNFVPWNQGTLPSPPCFLCSPHLTIQREGAPSSLGLPLKQLGMSSHLASLMAARTKLSRWSPENMGEEERALCAITTFSHCKMGISSLTKDFWIPFLVEETIWDMLFYHQFLEFPRHFIRSWVVERIRDNACKVSTCVVITILSKINIVFMGSLLLLFIILSPMYYHSQFTDEKVRPERWRKALSKSVASWDSNLWGWLQSPELWLLALLLVGPIEQTLKIHQILEKNKDRVRKFRTHAPGGFQWVG